MAKTKKGNGGKAVAVVLAAVVLAGGVCACGYSARDEAGQWFKNGDISTWHWSDNAPGDDVGGNVGNAKPGENNAATVGGSDITDITNNGVTVLKAVLPRAAYAANGVSEQAESAFTLTAEVSPDYASDKSLDWTRLEWQNADSAWAEGKAVTDYVTVTPNGNAAVLACLQDFGEPIVLTVSSVSNPEVFATCFIDYYQRVKSCEFAFFYDGVEVTPTVSNGVYKLDYTGAEKDYTVELRPVYSNYTLTDTYTTTINGALSDTFGYTATSTLTALTLPAGLTGGDPELSENALNWCQYVQSQVYSYSSYASGTNAVYINMGRTLCLGNSTSAYGHTFTPKYKLTEEEKLHPRCAYYISLLETQTITNDAEYEQAKTEFENYQPSAYTYYGAQIPSYNAFVAAVQSCNSNGVGVIEYTVNISGAHSNYETVLKLGYNDEFKTNVQDITLSDPNVAF